MDTSSEDSEYVCPLCLEEMDLTDRRFQPCQCGYQICLWCWHQVMELAVKNSTEGRCPACRTSYDKDKIIAASPDPEEVAESYVDKKQKVHKARQRAADRKHLSNVRVVQRNLVYLVGLPMGAADEEMLERREYLGQYGKVLKIAVSRSSNYNAPHAPSGPTASVYVTFVKEEDALRCIQALDGCSIEGKVLRACFGTTKYCNAWLKNMPCNNPDCLYLHEIGTQEDSFTKEEMLAKFGSKTSSYDALHPPSRRLGGGFPPSPDQLASPSSAAASPALLQPSLPPPAPSVATTSAAMKAVAIPQAPTATARTSGLPPAASWASKGPSVVRPQGAAPVPIPSKASGPPPGSKPRPIPSPSTSGASLSTANGSTSPHRRPSASAAVLGGRVIHASAHPPPVMSNPGTSPMSVASSAGSDKLPNMSPSASLSSSPVAFTGWANLAKHRNGNSSASVSLGSSPAGEPPAARHSVSGFAPAVTSPSPGTTPPVTKAGRQPPAGSFAAAAARHSKPHEAESVPQQPRIVALDPTPKQAAAVLAAQSNGKARGRQVHGSSMHGGSTAPSASASGPSSGLGSGSGVSSAVEAGTRMSSAAAAAAAHLSSAPPASAPVPVAARSVSKEDSVGSTEKQHGSRAAAAQQEAATGKVEPPDAKAAVSGSGEASAEPPEKAKVNASSVSTNAIRPETQSGKKSGRHSSTGGISRLMREDQQARESQKEEGEVARKEEGRHAPEPWKASGRSEGEGEIAVGAEVHRAAASDLEEPLKGGVAVAETSGGEVEGTVGESDTGNAEAALVSVQAHPGDGQGKGNVHSAGLPDDDLVRIITGDLLLTEEQEESERAMVTNSSIAVGAVGDCHEVHEAEASSEAGQTTDIASSAVPAATRPPGAPPPAMQDEMSVIADILGLDLDMWGEGPLNAPGDLAKIFASSSSSSKPEAVPGAGPSPGMPSRSSSSSGRQSRFRFAREEDEESIAEGRNAISSFFGGAFSQPAAAAAPGPPYGGGPAAVMGTSQQAQDHPFVAPGASSGGSTTAGMPYEENIIQSSFSGYPPAPKTGGLTPPPGFGAPARAQAGPASGGTRLPPPPPGFGAREYKAGAAATQEPHAAAALARWEHGHVGSQAAALSDSAEDPVSELEFLDPAIMAVGKGALPVPHRSSQSGAGAGQGLQNLSLGSFFGNHNNNNGGGAGQGVGGGGSSVSPVGSPYGLSGMYGQSPMLQQQQQQQHYHDMSASNLGGPTAQLPHLGTGVSALPGHFASGHHGGGSPYSYLPPGLPPQEPSFSGYPNVLQAFSGVPNGLLYNLSPFRPHQQPPAVQNTYPQQQTSGAHSYMRQQQHPKEYSSFASMASATSGEGGWFAPPQESEGGSPALSGKSSRHLFALQQDLQLQGPGSSLDSNFLRHNHLHAYAHEHGNAHMVGNDNCSAFIEALAAPPQPPYGAGGHEGSLAGASRTATPPGLGFGSGSGSGLGSSPQELSWPSMHLDYRREAAGGGEDGGRGAAAGSGVQLPYPAVGPMEMSGGSGSGAGSHRFAYLTPGFRDGLPDLLERQQQQQQYSMQQPPAYVTGAGVPSFQVAPPAGFGGPSLSVAMVDGSGYSAAAQIAGPGGVDEGDQDAELTLEQKKAQRKREKKLRRGKEKLEKEKLKEKEREEEAARAAEKQRGGGGGGDKKKGSASERGSPGARQRPGEEAEAVEGGAAGHCSAGRFDDRARAPAPTAAAANWVERGGEDRKEARSYLADDEFAEEEHMDSPRRAKRHKGSDDYYAPNNGMKRPDAAADEGRRERGSPVAVSNLILKAPNKPPLRVAKFLEYLNAPLAELSQQLSASKRALVGASWAGPSSTEPQRVKASAAAAAAASTAASRPAQGNGWELKASLQAEDSNGKGGSSMFSLSMDDKLAELAAQLQRLESQVKGEEMGEVTVEMVLSMLFSSSSSTAQGCGPRDASNPGSLGSCLSCSCRNAELGLPSTPPKGAVEELAKSLQAALHLSGDTLLDVDPRLYDAAGAAGKPGATGGTAAAAGGTPYNFPEELEELRSSIVRASFNKKQHAPVGEEANGCRTLGPSQSAVAAVSFSAGNDASASPPPAGSPPARAGSSGGAGASPAGNKCKAESLVELASTIRAGQDLLSKFHSFGLEQGLQEGISLSSLMVQELDKELRLGRGQEAAPDGPHQYSDNHSGSYSASGAHARIAPEMQQRAKDPPASPASTVPATAARAAARVFRMAADAALDSETLVDRIAGMSLKAMDSACKSFDSPHQRSPSSSPGRHPRPATCRHSTPAKCHHYGGGGCGKQSDGSYSPIHTADAPELGRVLEAASSVERAVAAAAAWEDSLRAFQNGTAHGERADYSNGLGPEGGFFKHSPNLTQVECLEREVASAREVEKALESRLMEVKEWIDHDNELLEGIKANTSLSQKSFKASVRDAAAAFVASGLGEAH
eukprot:jgi/Mesen1/1545/ME000134S00663